MGGSMVMVENLLGAVAAAAKKTETQAQAQAHAHAHAHATATATVTVNGVTKTVTANADADADATATAGAGPDQAKLADGKGTSSNLSMEQVMAAVLLVKLIEIQTHKGDQTAPANSSTPAPAASSPTPPGNTSTPEATQAALANVSQPTVGASGLPDPNASGIPAASSVPEPPPPPMDVSSGGGGDGGGGGGGDPLVFDLNRDGHTDATSHQHGVDVDGLHDTKWAAKGDGVLAFGANHVVDTDHGQHADAYETLAAHAKAQGIDTEKGFLDAADIKKLEHGPDKLGMLVSNGDGTNTHKSLTELGITRLDLKAKKVNEKDSAGNRVTAHGSYQRNGQTERVDDLWLQEIKVPTTT